ncbi:MAG: hypothetical protein LGB07_05525, partial [Sulfurovum sp.]|nr:hypothetical protein [Sulfurovum sp.]
KGRLAQKGREKMNYVARQFLAELGLSQWRSREFWGMMLMLLIVFWLHMYLHYIGQWLFLSAIRIPINKSVNCSACHVLIPLFIFLLHLLLL